MNFPAIVHRAVVCRQANSGLLDFTASYRSGHRNSRNVSWSCALVFIGVLEIGLPKTDIIVGLKVVAYCNTALADRRVDLRCSNKVQLYAIYLWAVHVGCWCSLFAVSAVDLLSR